jgi:hypothetical protein
MLAFLPLVKNLVARLEEELVVVVVVVLAKPVVVVERVKKVDPVFRLVTLRVVKQNFQLDFQEEVLTIFLKRMLLLLIFT